ncbi:MAG: ethanolamine utilization protein EutH [Clostridia bacterium]|nr:ethanolamine utilization protein EutH [Clostridia bacterium]
MGFNQIFITIVLVFAVIGVLDKITGNRYGYGKEFEKGFGVMGPLAISTLGVISIAPVMAKVLKPILVPIYSFLGADPSMFATTILACDMGGYSLAMELAQNEQSGLFSGLLLGSMLGPTITFMIPVALGIIRKEDYDYLAKGILIGIITIPIGCFAGGIVAGFDTMLIIHNLVPVIIVAVVFAVGLMAIPNRMIKGLKIFGQCIYAMVVLSTIIIVIQTLTKITIIQGMAPIWDGIKIVTNTAIILSGTFPLLFFIQKIFNKQIDGLGRLLNIGNTATIGLISVQTTCIVMFENFHEMDEHGKLLNMTYSVSGNALLGGHLAFTLAVYPQMLLPVLVGKFVAAVTAILIANKLYYKKHNKVIHQNDKYFQNA